MDSYFEQRTRDVEQVKLSIIAPAHNEEDNVQVLFHRVKAVLDDEFPKLSWSLIFVDDGSDDETWSNINALCAQFSEAKGLKLSRNFGHQSALVAGLSAASGGIALTLDCDLQHPPESIPDMLRAWEAGYDVVKTVRLDTGVESRRKRWGSITFYHIFSWLTGVELKPGMADFRLLDEKVLHALKESDERSMFLRGLVEWLGFEATEIEYEVHARESGSSSYGFSKMLKLAWDGVTSFSIVPLRLITAVGLMTSMISFSVVIYAIAGYLLSEVTVPGWASTLAILSFLLGILFVTLGVLAEYVGRILIETRRRPMYIVSGTVNL